jgi:hypothetical protein
MAVLITSRSEMRARLGVALDRIGHKGKPAFRERLADAFDLKGLSGEAMFPLVSNLNRTQRAVILDAAIELLRADPAEALWALEVAVRGQLPAEVLPDALRVLQLVACDLDELYRVSGRLAAELDEDLERENLELAAVAS